MLNSKNTFPSAESNTAQAFKVNEIKVDELLTTITEARKSLEAWQDKRTEALIQLDALSYDVKAIEDEKNRTRSRNEELQQELRNQTRIYETHIDTMTDQMQMLTLEKAELQSGLQAACQEIELQKREVAKQIEIQNQNALDHTLKTAEVKAECEKTAAEQQQQLRKTISELAKQAEILLHGKLDAEKKVAILDAELSTIRSQVLNVLKVSDVEPEPAAKAATPKLRAVETELTGSSVTVQDYLKRFGY